MAHEVENMAFAHETPWHGLGVRVADAIGTDAMMKAAKLDWSVTKQPIGLLDEHGNKASDAIDGHFALTRSTDGRVLDVVGSRYQVHQPRQVMEFFRSFTEAGGATLETAGSLKGGKLIWCLADLRKSFSLKGGDAVKGYLLLASPYQAGRATIARVTPIRVVCANTMAMAMSGSAAIEGRFSHATEFDPAVAAESLELVRDNVSEFETNAKLLRKLNLTEAEAIGILAPVYQPDGVEGHADYPEAAEILTARAEFRSPTLKKVLGAYESAPGASPGNGWGVLNAATYYADHLARGENRDSRLAAAWTGKEARRKTAVMQSLMELAQ